MRSKKEEQSKKKPYLKPNLRVYGDMQTITRTAGMGAISDGGKPHNKSR